MGSQTEKEQHYGRLGDVNTTSIKEAIVLGCRTMCRIFNRDDNNIPFFEAVARPEPQFGFCSFASESHVPGRHLNALLSAEETLGISVDEEAIQRHTDAAFFSFGGAVALPLNRDKIGGSLTNFYPHNIREGFHALYALARYRDSQKARDVATECLSTIEQLWKPECGWNIEKLEHGLNVKVFLGETFINGLGRAIGPLVKYYRATGHGEALDLALKLKEKAVGDYFLPSGEYDFNKMGAHSHSVTCTMSSLAQLADITDDHALLQRVKSFYDNGLHALRDDLGWSIEYAGEVVYVPGDLFKNPDRGEGNNTADIVETALILGRHGYPEYFADAERILRCHLLPSQLRDISFIRSEADPGDDDARRVVAERMQGAFGFPAPYGHEPLGLPRVRFNLDIVGGVVAGLCEAYSSIHTESAEGFKVCMLFDHTSKNLEVKSPYGSGYLTVRPRRPGRLLVRVPDWAATGDPLIEGTEAVEYRSSHGYIILPRPPANREIRIRYTLPLQDIILRHRTRSIRVRLRGDEVAAMDNFGADLTFFEPYE